MNQKLIGDKLKELRIARGLKQCQVADSLGLSRATVSNIENSHRSLTLNTLKKFANFYNVSVDYFELDDEADDVIDLLERTRKIFENEDVPTEEKESLYLEVMNLYLKMKKNNSL